MPVVAGAAIPTWRWLIADMDSSTITFLDRHARDRSIEYRLNTPMQGKGVVSSYDPEINRLHTDGFPTLTEGDRLVYCFRRDYNGIFSGSDVTPWVVRAAGVILQLQDNAFSENAESTFTFYDPWQVLYRRPVWNPNVAAGDQGTLDTTYPATPIDDIIIDLLDNMSTFNSPMQPGASAFAFIDWGQTGSSYGGTIESLPAITITFEKEVSIGEAFDQLCARGNVDIVLTPIYDPVNRPGYTHELSIYQQVGAQQPEAIFAWDKPSRSVAGIDRSIDGTQRANNVRFHVGQGGDVTSTAVSNVSMARFGEYWQTQFFVAAEHQETIADYADELLDQVAQNKRTVTLDVMPERCPDPFLEWNLGDEVRVFASSNFRSTQSGFQRVNAFTLGLDDGGVERVSSLEVFIDTNDDPPPPSLQTTVSEVAVRSALSPTRWGTQSILRPPAA